LGGGSVISLTTDCPENTDKRRAWTVFTKCTK
jgi:hypothetical protein